MSDAPPSLGQGRPPALAPSLRPIVLAALTEFFDKPLDANFAILNPAEKAKTLAAYLCGLDRTEFPARQVTPSCVASRADVPLYDLSDTYTGTPTRRRVLLTGCFDLMHAGHYNALRQAKAAYPGEEITLVAGVHADDAIEKAKGAPTVLEHDERVELVQSCRWVDEVAIQLPYEVPVALLDRLGCDVAVHGDDLPRIITGGGLFDELMKADRLKIVKRTEGTSTTVLIGRLLSMSKEHLLSQTADEKPESPELVSKQAFGKAGEMLRNTNISSAAHVSESTSSPTPVWMLLPTMSRMALFYGERPRRLGDAGRVVYAPGEWDLFHVGHARFLQKARSLGDFLLVGCYNDEIIHQKKGYNYPLQTLHERSLNVLACRHTDDVLLGAPWQVSEDLLKTLNVSVVVTGQNNVYASASPPDFKDPCGLGDPFEVPRSAGILTVLESDCSLTMDVIAERILLHTAQYTIRQRVKETAERTYTVNKEFVAET